MSLSATTSYTRGLRVTRGAGPVEDGCLGLTVNRLACPGGSYAATTSAENRLSPKCSCSPYWWGCRKTVLAAAFTTINELSQAASRHAICHRSVTAKSVPQALDLHGIQPADMDAGHTIGTEPMGPPTWRLYSAYHGLLSGMAQAPCSDRSFVARLPDQGIPHN
jgi:hypothetical protein